MAFTAGSVELARAEKLARQLNDLYVTFGSNMSGETGAAVVEKYAKKLGFGITGITTGKGFPLYGNISGKTGGSTRGLTRLTAALQNPDGLTQPNGVTADPNFTLQGLTVGIYNEKYVFAGPAPAGITAGNPNRGYTSGVSGLTFEAYGFSAASMVIGYTATIYYGVTGGTVG
jgi:hypothetical protein